MATEENATWFDGAKTEYVKNRVSAETPKLEYLTPMTDALPRTPDGLGYLKPWFDEESGHVRWNRNDE